jgi:ATP-dependent Clp protease ATP-binding subunit ClpC
MIAADMREAFTDTLRHVIASAQTGARRLNQEFVGTEHLLLGILECDSCEAARALQRNGLAPADLRAAMLRILPKGAHPPVVTGDLPITPKAQRAINGALVKSQTLRSPRVSTRFALLSLLDEPDTVIRDVFKSAGADLDQLQRLLVEKPVDEET